MKPFQQNPAVRTGAGLGLLIAIGWLSSAVLSGASPVQSLKSGPITESVIAPAEQLGTAFAMVTQHVRSAVVSVYSEKTVKRRQEESPYPQDDDLLRQFFGTPMPYGQPNQFGQQAPQGQPQRGMGSGMILDVEGHILTNNHVVNDVDQVKVKLADGRQFEAEIVSTDPKTDVAVIKIKSGVPRDLPVVQLGDSDALVPGGLVMAIGAPFGLTQTVTQGIISATGRSNVGIADFEDFLQTDASINPGNSGGPLVNMHGEVIGMNSAIATSVGQSAGVGFAIPINMIKAMLPTLVKGKKVTRGMLGVIIQDVDEDLAGQFQLSEPTGALVAQVNKGSPAEKAGIKVGDVIVRFDGKSVQNSRELRNRVASTEPGTRVKVDVLRNGKPETVTAEVTTLDVGAVDSSGRPVEPGDHDQLTEWGLTVQNLTPDLATQFGLEAQKGALISGVRAGGPASVAGLQMGDLIMEADHQAIASVNDLREVLAKAKSGAKILLLLERHGASLFVVMQGK